MADMESHRAPDFVKVKSGAEALAMLGLPQSADAAEVKAAYRKLAMENHPDLHPGDRERLAKFLAISYAYELLTNPDFKRHEEAAANQQDLNIQAQLGLRFDDAFFGKSIRLCFNFADQEFTDPLPAGDKLLSVDLTLDPVVVVVKPGTVSGASFNFPGKGLRRGSARGDLKITTVVQHHPMFRLDGPNVVTQLQVPLHVMLAGGEVDTPTMWGIRTLIVPAGTAPGEHLKLRKAGVSKQGDQLVEIVPKFPSKSDLKTDHWHGFDINWDLGEQAATGVDPEMDRIRKVFMRWNP